MTNNAIRNADRYMRRRRRDALRESWQLREAMWAEQRATRYFDPARLLARFDMDPTPGAWRPDEFHTAADTARILGVPYETLRGWQCGRSWLDEATAERLAVKVVGVPACDIWPEWWTTQPGPRRGWRQRTIDDDGRVA
jgi:hypothetical protein